MAERLTKAGFWVTYVPFVQLNALGLRRWASEVKALWLDRTED
jgi:hypothetical protein